MEYFSKNILLSGFNTLAEVYEYSRNLHKEKNEMIYLNREQYRYLKIFYALSKKKETLSLYHQDKETTAMLTSDAFNKLIENRLIEAKNLQGTIPDTFSLTEDGKSCYEHHKQESIWRILTFTIPTVISILALILSVVLKK